MTDIVERLHNQWAALDPVDEFRSDAKEAAEEIIKLREQLKQAQDECTQWEVDYNELKIVLEAVKANADVELERCVFLAMDKGFNEGIEAAALKAEENDCYIIGGDIRALKRKEVKHD